jgi:hypothetical protein
MTLGMLGLDSGQDLNRKDTYDFILFPTGIHMLSSDQWFRGYALSKLTNAAEILRRIDQRETDYFKILTNIQNETLETLNTKHGDIFLRFPMNICVPFADKPSNGYGCWKTAQGEIFDGNLEID